jgi:glycosyltransferase involved in cell wall biosynthesis
MQAKVAFRGISEDKAVVIPNGVDFQRIEKAEQSIDQAKRTDVLFYGRLVWAKGVTYLIDALAQLKRDFPSIRAKLIGTGPLFDRLKRVVDNRDMIHNVQFLGYLPREEVLREIFRSSVIALPSIYEAGSVAVLEAMACGRPVVAFDYAFTREFVKDLYSGLLAKPNDSSDLATKIRLLLQDEKRRTELGRNGSRLAHSAYNWEILAEKYVRVYRELEP